MGFWDDEHNRNHLSVVFRRRFLPLRLASRRTRHKSRYLVGLAHFFHRVAR